MIWSPAPLLKPAIFPEVKEAIQENRIPVTLDDKIILVDVCEQIVWANGFVVMAGTGLT
jgi:hypothetical protein